MESSSLEEWACDNKLSDQTIEALRNIGVENFDDLAVITPEILKDINLKPVQRERLRAIIRKTIPNSALVDTSVSVAGSATAGAVCISTTNVGDPQHAGATLLARATPNVEPHSTEVVLKGEASNVIKFDENDLRHIVGCIVEKDLPTLQKFKDIDSLINSATGSVPNCVITELQKLSAAHSTITMKLKIGFSDTCAVTTRFVIRGIRAIRDGLSEDNMRELRKLSSQLNSGFVEELDLFMEASRAELLAIHQALLTHAMGGRAVHILENREKFERTLEVHSQTLRKLAQDVGTQKGIVESLKYEIEFLQGQVEDSKKTKADLEKELTELKKLLPEYERDVQAHRDEKHEEWEHLWIFSWKVRDVYVDNGERIAVQSLAALNERIKLLSCRINDWSDCANFADRIKIATGEKIAAEVKLVELNQEYTNEEKARDDDQSEFDKLAAEMEENYKNMGTRDMESFKAIDTLAKAIHTGSGSMLTTYNKLRTNLKTIDANPDLLVSSITCAIELLQISDQYNESNTIQKLQSLCLK